MDSNAIADHVAAIVIRLQNDQAFVQSLGITNGTPIEKILDLAIRRSDPPAAAPASE